MHARHPLDVLEHEPRRVEKLLVVRLAARFVCVPRAVQGAHLGALARVARVAIDPSIADLLRHHRELADGFFSALQELLREIVKR